MPTNPSGPDFERAPGQGVIPGDYSEPKAPGLPDPPTLMERLRARITPRKRRSGPGFRKPRNWRAWAKSGPVAPPDQGNKRRPSGYHLPGSDAGQQNP